MNFKEKKEQIKNWVKENKFNIGLGVAGVVTVVVLAINTMKPDTKEDIEKEFYEESNDKFDPGRQLEMQFVDPETKEILGKVDCYESYMNDFI